MKKPGRWQRIVGLLIGLGIVLWRWPYLNLPGEIAMECEFSTGYRAIYLSKPGLFLCGKRITPLEIYAMYPVWAPDGKQVAFWCSDGVVRGGYVYRSKELVPETYDPQQTVVREGICIVDRDGKHFRWLVDTETLPDMAYKWGNITWTLDGQYIVFPGSRREESYRVDPESGEWAVWNSESDVQEWRYWEVEFSMTENAARSAKDFCPLYGGTHHGSSSPGGRYVIFSMTYGESDPRCLYIYDTMTERLLYLGRMRGFSISDLVWFSD